MRVARICGAVLFGALALLTFVVPLLLFMLASALWPTVAARVLDETGAVLPASDVPGAVVDALASLQRKGAH